MILADTSVWIEHISDGINPLHELLRSRSVTIHSHIIGELACGNLADRSVRLKWLRELPRVGEASFAEVLDLIDEHSLMGQGVGWIDCHLLASALIHDTPLWTLDRRLSAIASRLNISHVP